MPPGVATGIYRRLLVLYPRDFRQRYATELTQTLADMTDELGARRAFARAALDLVVTVPRYRIETLMNERHQPAFLTATIVLLGALGLLAVPLGLPIGLLLLPLAVALGVTQRSKLARSLDPDSTGDNPRRRRLTIAAVLVAMLPVVYLVSLPILGDEWGGDAIVAFGLWFAVLMAAVGYFVAGISTPRSAPNA